LLIKEKQLIDLIFNASLYGVPFDLLIKDFEKKSESEHDEIRYLDLFWSVDYDKDGLFIEPDFHGKAQKNNHNADETPFGLDFVSICEFKNYPLRLNESLEIIDNSRLRDENRTILKTTKKFTLYEIIHAILYELSWYGTPEKRDKNGKEILEQVRKIETVDDVFESDIAMRYLRIEVEKESNKKINIDFSEKI